MASTLDAAMLSLVIWPVQTAGGGLLRTRVLLKIGRLRHTGHANLSDELSDNRTVRGWTLADSDERELAGP